MGRLIGFILGGVALALYGPPLFLPAESFTNYDNWLRETLGATWYAKVYTGHMPGILAGIALLLLAVRGKD